MNTHLRKFEVHLVLEDIDASVNANALDALGTELSMRGHIESHEATWDDERKERVTVDLRTQGVAADSAGKQAAEELFEVACAVLRKVDGIHVNIARVDLLDDPAA